MAEISRSDLEFYKNIIASDECICGRQKKTGFAYCYRCYSSIADNELKAGLNLFRNRSVALFAATYEECYKELADNGVLD